MKYCNCASCLFCDNSDGDTGLCLITECIIEVEQEACNDYRPENEERED